MPGDGRGGRRCVLAETSQAVRERVRSPGRGGQAPKVRRARRLTDRLGPADVGDRMARATSEVHWTIAWPPGYRPRMDIHSTGRAIHALAALRDSNGDVAKAAGRLGIRPDQVVEAVETGGSALYERLGDGRIMPTQMGLGFAERISTFPYVNW